MNHKLFAAVASVVFFAVSVAHLARLIGGWHVEVGQWVVPQWVSLMGLIVPGLLAAWGFTVATRTDRANP
jgi:hypothetical protein